MRPSQEHNVIDPLTARANQKPYHLDLTRMQSLWCKSAVGGRLKSPKASPLAHPASTRSFLHLAVAPFQRCRRRIILSLSPLFYRQSKDSIHSLDYQSLLLFFLFSFDSRSETPGSNDRTQEQVTCAIPTIRPDLAQLQQSFNLHVIVAWPSPSVIRSTLSLQMAHSHQHLHRRHSEKQNLDMEQFIRRDPAPEPQTTILSVVYVTAAQTFSGSVAGYTTLSESGSAETTQASDPPAASSSVDDFSTSSTAAANTSGFLTVTGLVGTSSTAESHSSLFVVSSATSLITSTAAVSQFSTVNPNSAVAAASATASSSSHASSSSSGMSTGAKIGIAVGVIILLVAVAGGVLLAYWKKKKQHEEYARQDEKAALAASAAAAINKAPSPAPRLSLRPMSRLMRFSGGNLLNNVNAPNTAQSGLGRNLTPSPNMGAAPAASRSASPWERRADANPQNPNNPFNDPQNPFSDHEKGVSPPPTAISGEMAAVGAGVAGVGAVVATGAMAAKSRNEPPRKASPEPMNTTGAGSPDAASNVHRVQLDFKPSMDDELELKAGQLVRMLHEYDDGWALCIRLDRSQQGVAPRTCLSPKPCKPRPAGGPNGPGPRGMNGPPNGRMSPAMGTPSGRNSPAFGPPNGRMSPAMGRPAPPQARPMSPMTPAGARGPPRMAPQHQQNNSSASINQFNQGPRPLSPGPRPSPKPRSQSPGPYGAQGPRSMAPPGQRRRSNSAGGVLMPQGRMSPAPLNPSRLGPGAPSQWPLPANGGRPV